MLNGKTSSYEPIGTIGRSEPFIKALNLKTFFGNKEDRNSGIFENFLGPGVSQFINSLSLELGSAITEI
jgi:hypothetical protein